MASQPYQLLGEKIIIFPQLTSYWKPSTLIEEFENSLKGTCVPMIFSDCCYLTGLIKEALCFKLMTTAAFWHQQSYWFLFLVFLELHAKTTQMTKTFFRTVIVSQPTEWASTTSFSQPPTVKHWFALQTVVQKKGYHTTPCLSLNKEKSLLNWTFEATPTVSSWHGDIWWISTL